MQAPPSLSEQVPTLYLFTPYPAIPLPLSLYPLAPLPATPIPYPFAPGLAASLFAYVGRAIVLPVSE